MNKELNVFTLRMLRDQYQAEHLDTEAEALEAAIAALEQPELIEQGAYVRGFEQGRTQGMLDAKLQPTCNQLATDCISRQAAIEALKGLPTWWADSGGYYDGAQPPMEALLDPEDAISALENLPSAQPYTEAEIQKMQDLEQAELDKAFELGQQEDTISRQAAINALCKSGCDSTYCGVSCPDVMAIENLPSAQPEQHGVCRDCTMKNICRYKTGLGDYGYCSQWRGEEHG